MWNTPKTWVTGESPSNGRFNLELRDNLVTLKRNSDLIYEVAENSPPREFLTPYTNTGYDRFVIITIELADPTLADFSAVVESYVGETYLSLAQVGYIGKYGRQTQTFIQTVFVVPPNYYYWVSATGVSCTPEITYWYEYDIHRKE